MVRRINREAYIHERSNWREIPLGFPSGFPGVQHQMVYLDVSNQRLRGSAIPGDT
jgi:hypothetical protein